MNPVMHPFFLEAPARKLYCIAHRPHTSVSPRGNVLYVPPFAEEMHKSRRMAAQEARHLAQRGITVLILDLHGCGDSSGDFVDASWDTWLEDIRLGTEWLRAQAPGPVVLWGLRLGALLALEAAQYLRDVITALIMWQPVISGDEYLSEILRIKAAGDILLARKTTIHSLRQRLSLGDSVDLRGYELNAGLATSLTTRTITAMAVSGLAAGWFEVVTEAGAPISQSSQQVIEVLKHEGMEICSAAISGDRFWYWNATDITECSELLTKTDCYLDSMLGTP